MPSAFATKLLTTLRAQLNQRSVAFLACLILATLFWLLTSLSKDYVDEISIPVAYANMPEDLLVANKLTTQVSAQTKGGGFSLLWYKLQFEKVEIPVNANPVNLPRVTKNGQTFHYILLGNKGLEAFRLDDDQLEIQDVYPDTLFIQYKPKYVKKVAVKLDAEITFEKQFGMVEEAKIEPDSVLLTGLKEEIDTIAFVRTQPQTWNNLDESLSSKVELRSFSDLPLITVSASTATVELNVVEFTEGSVSIPLNIIARKPGSVKVFPSVVDITFQVPLDAYDSVSADQFQASVVLNDLQAGQTRLTVNIDRHPDFVKNVRVNPSQVEFIIQQ